MADLEALYPDHVLPPPIANKKPIQTWDDLLGAPVMVRRVGARAQLG